ncbi:MAG TPA: glycosyltransferase family 4 protein [Candidatus Moranbacteria bacterium]|nr:glycosyltransferase family 4 protein [Candidatus Moranbacteria bacterium]
MKIALVHDYLVQYGGAERVLETFSEIWPHAPIYTLLYNPEAVHHLFDQREVRTSYLQKMPLVKKNHRLFPPLMMNAIEQFNFNYYDVVLSDSSSFPKNIITGPDTLHISYCHTPMRYGWDDCQYYTQEFSFPELVKKMVPFLMSYIRIWDYYSTNGVDKFIANSEFVSRRIKKYYGRESTVINPPIKLSQFFIAEQDQMDDYFLVVGRMMKYKKIDLVIRAFNKLKLPLKIVGRGVEYNNLKKIAGPTIDFLGRVPDSDLPIIYAKAQAFVFPQEEDFGIVATEALASGRPIIAFRAGDIEERIVDGQNGVFFEKQTVDDLVDAVKRFQQIKFNPIDIRKTVLKFEREEFKIKIKDFVENEYLEFKKKLL